MKQFDLKYKLRTYGRTSVLLVFLMLNLPAYAQVAEGNALQVFCTSKGSAITVSYRPPGVVHNLLVQISDSGGRTVFLENKYKFSGSYQCVFNAGLWEHDVLQVQLIADNKRFNKTIKLR